MKGRRLVADLQHHPAGPRRGVSTPPPLATIGVTPTYGAWYDRLVGEAIRWGTGTKDAYSGLWRDSRVNHAVLYVGPQVGHAKPQAIEARPGGAGLCDWDKYGSDMIWLTGLRPAMPQAQREVIAAAGVSFQGIEYGYLDILAVGLAQKRLGSEVDVTKVVARQPWWVQRVESMHTMICSQLCDAAYLAGGVHLFNDGRLPGLVSPADLLALDPSATAR